MINLWPLRIRQGHVGRLSTINCDSFPFVSTAVLHCAKNHSSNSSQHCRNRFNLHDSPAWCIGVWLLAAVQESAVIELRCILGALSWSVPENEIIKGSMPYINIIHLVIDLKDCLLLATALVRELGDCTALVCTWAVQVVGVDVARKEEGGCKFEEGWVVHFEVGWQLTIADWFWIERGRDKTKRGCLMAEAKQRARMEAIIIFLAWQDDCFVELKESKRSSIQCGTVCNIDETIELPRYKKVVIVKNYTAL